MQAHLTELNFVVGAPERLRGIQDVAPLEIFSRLAIDFLNQLSSALLTNRMVKNYPDVVTFAFFCRKANVTMLKKRYLDGTFRLGRGVVFHITPSNVPVNFAYSLVAGILAGNANIVRVSSKDFVQVDMICTALETILVQPEFFNFTDRVYIVKYGRNSSLNAVLSMIADVRVIWGGDETIATIRKSPLPARSYDVTFSDRYSFAVINADALVHEPDMDKLARAFYNDTYLFDQNACSAPRLVVWIGTVANIGVAKNYFWSAVENQLMAYPLDSIVAIDKLSTLLSHSGGEVGFQKVDSHTNKLWRIEVDQLSDDIDGHRCACGYFLEYIAASLNEISKSVNRKYQTLAYYGYSAEEIGSFIRAAGLLGIDRVVPIGTTTDFSLVWDGHDLIRDFSRECTIL
jgi:hypothetical protein